MMITTVNPAQYRPYRAALDEPRQAGGFAAVVFPAAHGVGPLHHPAKVPIDVGDDGTVPFEKAATFAAVK